MTGELKRHDVDAIYEAAFKRARQLRWPPWPDLKPQRRRRRARRCSLIGVATVAILCAALGIYAASADWLGLPTLESALRSLATFDGEVASAPDVDTAPHFVLAPLPESPTDAAEVIPSIPEDPFVAGSAQPVQEPASGVAATAPVPSEPLPTPPAVTAAPPEFAQHRSAPAVAETGAVRTDSMPNTPEPAAAPVPSPPSLPEAAGSPPPDIADAVSEAALASDPSAAETIPVSRGAGTVKNEAPTAVASPPFPLPPRRPVLAATRAPMPPAAEAAREDDSAARATRSAAAASPSTAPANGNIFHLGPGPRPTLPPAPGIEASGPKPVDAGRVGNEPAAAVATETAGSSVAAASRPCPDGSSADCPRAHNWYVGAQLSVAANAAGTFTAPGVDVKGELEKLGGTNLFAGYRSNLGTRFEAELFYRRHDFSDVTVNSDGGAGSFLGTGDLDGTSGDAQGHLSMAGMMANVFQDFRLMDSVTPFIGGGIGVARVNVNNGGLQSAALMDGNDDVFAYQIGGGVNFALDDRLDVFFEYRYFATDEYDMQYVTGDAVQGKITSHNLGVGLRYGF